MTFRPGELERLYLHCEIKLPIKEDWMKFQTEDERRPPKNDGSARSVAFLATQVATRDFPCNFFGERPPTPPEVSAAAREIAFLATQIACRNIDFSKLIVPIQINKKTARIFLAVFQLQKLNTCYDRDKC